MAFKAKLKQYLPETMEGIYLFPLWWLSYGIMEKHLEVEDPKKYAESLQGSVCSWLLERMNKTRSKFKVRMAEGKFTRHDDGTVCDMWLEYHPGGEIYMIYYPSSEYKGYVERPNSEKFPELTVIGLDTLSKMSINDQKSINHQYISLFAGCGLKLVDSVWFTNMNNLFG